MIQNLLCLTSSNSHISIEKHTGTLLKIGLNLLPSGHLYLSHYDCILKTDHQVDGKSNEDGCLFPKFEIHYHTESDYLTED